MEQRWSGWVECQGSGVFRNGTNDGSFETCEIIFFVEWKKSEAKRHLFLLRSGDHTNIADDGCHAFQRQKLAHVVKVVGFSERAVNSKIDRGPGRRRTRTNEEGIHHDNL